MFNTLTRMGASGAGGDYEIEKSLRFNSTDSAYLDRDFASTPSSQSLRTISYWIKRSTLGTNQMIIHGYTSSNVTDYHYLNGDVLKVYIDNSTGASDEYTWTTNAVFRDISAWYHVVVKYDLTESSQADRVKIYVNNVLQSVTSSGNGTTQSRLLDNGTNVKIGNYFNNSTYYDGYLAEFNCIDGQALNPSSFGETNEDTGQWIPKKYSGSYGNNGFYLNFSDNSGTTATTLGKDSSGNSENFTPNNFSVAAGVTNDVFTDTPTNNFCTMNSIVPASAKDGTLTNGNLEFGGTDQALQKANWHFGPNGITTGKWMWEINDVASSGSNQFGKYAGITSNLTQDAGEIASTADKSWASTTTGFCKDYTATSSTATGTGSITSDNHESPGVMTFALDLDAQTIKYYYNGTLLRTDSTIPDPAVTEFVPFAFTTNSGGSADWTVSHWNFGQRAFSHEQTDYKSLCTANLPDPTIAKSSEYFKAGIYAGDSSAQTFTDVGFQPDKIVVKVRDRADKPFVVVDSVRGINDGVDPGTPWIAYNSQNQESTQGGRVTAVSSTGFTIGTDSDVNSSGYNFAYWAWKESATAGFDIVSYTGNGSSSRTVSHSLGVAPELMHIKRRDGANDIWVTQNKTIDADENLFISSSDDDENVQDYWDNTRPTSSVFTVSNGASVNNNGDKYIAYLWASVPGFSKVGTYTGNDSNDGHFLHLGFRPAFFLVKNTNDNEHWAIYDNARGYNGDMPYIVPSGYNNGVELSDVELDFVSNGIKFRQGHNRTNYAEGGSAYIYLAIASNPFKYANAR